MKRHLWNIHDIGDKDLYYCEQKDCKYKTKQKGNLTIHLWEVHTVGKGLTFTCEEEGCEYLTRTKKS